MKNVKFRVIFTLLTALLSLNTFAQRISGTLPVVYVNTENGTPITSKEEYLTADCWIDPLNTGHEAVGSESEPLLLQIRGRGNYTWVGFDKKPYKLKFDKKQKILGMKKSKHFALLAHADDNLGFMRNTLGFELSRRLGLPWTPGQQPVELVLNGDYRGIYFLTENIRVDEDRVNIVEQPDNATDPQQITGGWLVEIDNYDSDPHVTVKDGRYDVFITYKTPEVLSSAQEKYLKDQMQKLSDMFNSSQKSTSPWEEYVDLDQLVRYYIVQEILDDAESFHGSCYLYKDMGELEKWKFGPVWDFGNSFRRGDSQLFIYEYPPYGQTWIGEIAKFDSFQKKVKEVWQEFINEDYEGLASFLNDFKNQISSAAVSDSRRWPNYGNSNIQADYDNFMGLVSRRVKWLNDQWGDGKDIPAPDPIPTEVYLRGDFNNWRLDTPFTLGEDGLYYLVNVSVGNSKFKISDSDWSLVDLGSNGEEIVLDEPYALKKVGDNITHSQDFNDVDFILDLTEGTLLVTPTGGHDVPDPGVAVYLRGDFNNWSISHPFTLLPDGLYYITDISIGDSRFKIADAEWGDLNFGSNGDALRVGTPYQLTPFTNENITSSTYLEHMDFIFDLENETLTVAETGTLGITGRPVESSVRIEGKHVTAEGTIRVFDITGRLLQQGENALDIAAKGLLLIVTEKDVVKHLF